MNWIELWEKSDALSKDWFDRTIAREYAEAHNLPTPSKEVN